MGNATSHSSVSPLSARIDMQSGTPEIVVEVKMSNGQSTLGRCSGITAEELAVAYSFLSPPTDSKAGDAAEFIPVPQHRHQKPPPSVLSIDTDASRTTGINPAIARARLAEHVLALHEYLGTRLVATSGQ